MNGTGGKIGALAEQRDLILPVRSRMLSDLLAGSETGAARKKLLARVGELTLFRAELDAHCQALFSAAVACEHGIAGTVPDNWEQVGGGEPYDAHQEVAYALKWAPGRERGLSPSLLECLNELPGERSADFAEALSAATASLPIPSFSPENDYGAGPKNIIPEEVGGLAHEMGSDLREKNLFLVAYNQNIAQAYALAKSGGDLKTIHQLIS